MEIQIDELANTVIEELKGYSSEVAEETKKAVKETAKECLSDVKSNSPVRKKHGGKYKKGWKVKVNYDGPDDTRVTVYNKTDYQLTHLLEKGHAKRGGGRTRAFPHIKPAEEKAEEKLMDKIKVAIK